MIFDEAGRRGGIGPLAAGGLEGVEAEADVGAVDFLHDLPDGFPGRGVRRPAPVFVREPVVVRGEEVGELGEVGGDGVG